MAGVGPVKPLKVYTEALETVGHTIEFVAPEDGSYVAVLLNKNANAVDVAVEIRLSPAIHGRTRKLWSVLNAGTAVYGQSFNQLGKPVSKSSTLVGSRHFCNVSRLPSQRRGGLQWLNAGAVSAAVSRLSHVYPSLRRRFCEITSANAACHTRGAVFRSAGRLWE